MDRVKFSNLQDPNKWEPEDTFEASVEIYVNCHWRFPPKNIAEEVERRGFIVEINKMARKYENEIAARLEKELNELLAQA